MKVIIIGAGASGLCAAIEAAKQDNHVTVLELKDIPGKKILATGNGRCNMTNTQLDTSCYHSDDINFVKNVIDTINTENIKSYFNDMGLILCDINGYIYPYSKQASTVVDILYNTARKLGVEFVFNCNVKDIKKNIDNGFDVICNITNNKEINKETLYSDKVIVSAGGKAYKNLGSDGSGYYLLSKLGHNSIDVIPALVPLLADEAKHKKELSYIKGVRCNGNVKLFCEDEKIDESSGEIQFMDYGLSGIVIFQISRNANYLLSQKKSPYIIIDFLPEYDINQLICFAKNYISNFDISKTKETYDDIIKNFVNDKIAKLVCDRALSRIDKPIDNDFDKDIYKVLDCLKSFSIDINGSKGFDNAQVSSGGISLLDVNGTMESKLVDGLYITGEVLNADGICGGYNLHFAFATGIIAGRSV